jgi:hypothetical protein
MRTLILKIGLLSCTVIPGIAQDKGKGELAVSFGILPTEHVAAEVFSIFFLALLGEQPDKKIDHGTFAFSYKYRVSKKVAVGACGAYNAFAFDDTVMDWPDTDPRAKTFTFAGEANLYYLKKTNLDLYGSLGAGMFVSWQRAYDGVSQKNYVSPTLHCTAFGMRVGKDVGGFLELGYGFKGMVNGGLSFRF